MLRQTLRSTHRWVGLAGGLFFCILAVTGGLVTFRPQIASLMSPPVAHDAPCISRVDWDQAEHDVESFSQSRINRIYAPTAPDTRYRFRVMTDRDAIYRHVIYDACAGKVIGTANLAWMDWMVDFHHNLRFDRAGRQIGGWLGIVLLISALGGLLLWLVSNPGLARILRIRRGPHMPRDLHTSVGIAATVLLLVASFTGAWLTFPQTMRAMLSSVVAVPADVRPPQPRRESGGAKATLGQVMLAARQAIPDGDVREIRMPAGYGNVQVRMWREGDFRSLGNNVVFIDNRTGRVVATDLYASKSAASRFIQAMAGLHYGEWGGPLYRVLYGVAGLASGLLFATGLLIWWLPKRVRARQRAAISAETIRTAGNIS